MKAVVFDMDGILFDTEKLGFAAWDYASKKMNIPPASELAYKTLGMNVTAVDKILKEHYGLDFDVEKFRSASHDYTYDYFKKHGVPQKPCLKESLEILKKGGFKIALASSTSKKGVYRNLKDADIENYFDAVVCGDMIEKSKPEPDIYLKAANLLGESPKNCFAVEDSKNGILSAHSAGMKVIMIPDLWQGDNKTDRLLFARCKDLKEAAELIISSV